MRLTPNRQCLLPLPFLNAIPGRLAYGSAFFMPKEKYPPKTPEQAAEVEWTIAPVTLSGLKVLSLAALAAKHFSAADIHISRNVPMEHI